MSDSENDENKSHADGMLLSEARSVKLFDGGVALKKWKGLASPAGVLRAKENATEATKKFFTGGRTRRRRGKKSRRNARKSRRR